MNRFPRFRLPDPLHGLLALSWAILAMLSPISNAQTALDNPYPNPYEWMYEPPNAGMGDPMDRLYENFPAQDPRRQAHRAPGGVIIVDSPGPGHRTYMQWHPDWGAPPEAPYVPIPPGSFYDDGPWY